MLRAAESTGIHSTGYEIVPEICEKLTRYGRRVLQGGYADFVQSDIEADAVAMLEVLEHLPQPRETVKTILTSKHPRYFFAVVPDYRERRRFDTSFGRHDVPPNHLTWWCERSLAKVLMHPGYQITVVQVQEQRTSILRNILRGDISTSTTPLPEWITAVISPPSFWYLGVACRK
jgi:hypothetical protein